MDFLSLGPTLNFAGLLQVVLCAREYGVTFVEFWDEPS